MKSADDIIAAVERMRTHEQKMYKEYKDKIPTEAAKHLSAIHALDNLLDEIDTQEHQEVKVLVSVPETPKREKTFLTIYLNIFSLVVYFASLFFIGSFLGDLFDKVEFLDGGIGSILEYGYYLIHTASYLGLLLNVHLLKWK